MEEKRKIKRRHVGGSQLFCPPKFMTSAASPKKRKQTQDGAAVAPKKKAKHDLVSDVSTAKNRDKGKGKETAFQVVQSSLVLSISPVFASNPRAGVEEMLDSMIMRSVQSCLIQQTLNKSYRYIPALDGVVLSHSNLSFKDDTASIQADCPFLVCKIIFDATVWRPAVGMKLGRNCDNTVLLVADRI